MAAEFPSRRFFNLQDWHNFFPELVAHEQGGRWLNQLRFSCYERIERLRERPLLVYATKFLGGIHPAAPVAIEPFDIDGFTDLAGSVDQEHQEVDIILHSPGGNPEATERIVYILRNRFRRITFLVPHSAFSAATMLALSGNDIILHPIASLGPIDPQINGIPARSIRRGFDRVRELLKEQGPEALPAYLPLIEKHSLELLEICDDSLKLSRELVTEWLGKYMFAGEIDSPLIAPAVEFLSDYDTHKTHGRPITYDKLQALNLRITVAEQPLAELMREAYILFNGFLEGTTFVKLFENSKGLSWGRQFEIRPTPVPPTPTSPTAPAAEA